MAEAKVVYENAKEEAKEFLGNNNGKTRLGSTEIIVEHIERKPTAKYDINKIKATILETNPELAKIFDEFKTTTKASSYLKVSVKEVKEGKPEVKPKKKVKIKIKAKPKAEKETSNTEKPEVKPEVKPEEATKQIAVKRNGIKTTLGSIDDVPEKADISFDPEKLEDKQEDINLKQLATDKFGVKLAKKFITICEKTNKKNIKHFDINELQQCKMLLEVGYTKEDVEEMFKNIATITEEE